MESKLGVRLQVAIAEPQHRIKFALPKTAQDLIATPSPTPPAVRAATAIPAISAASAAAFDLWTRFVHIQCAPTNLRAIQRRDGLFSVFRTRHLHEAKAARAPGIPVRHDADPVHLSVYLEKLAQFVF